MKQLTSSVIICTRNRMQDIGTCLKYLTLQRHIPNELIIVDSSDVSLQSNQEFNEFFSVNCFPSTHLQYVHTQPGLTYQRNVGISLATGEIIYFFDDDVILEPTYLYQMQEIFANYTHYGGGMGSITNIPAKTSGWQRLLRTVFLLQRDYADGAFTWSGMPTHAYGRQEFKHVEVLGGCCMAYRKTVLQEHTFDETLTRYAYMEDCDMSRRVSQKNLLFYHPGARLQHLNSPLARDKVAENRAMFIRNYSYLFFKNFYPHQQIRVFAYLWSIIGLFVEALLIRNGDYIRGYVHGLSEYWRFSGKFKEKENLKK